MEMLHVACMFIGILWNIFSKLSYWAKSKGCIVDELHFPYKVLWLDVHFNRFNDLMISLQRFNCKKPVMAIFQMFTLVAGI